MKKIKLTSNRLEQYFDKRKNDSCINNVKKIVEKYGLNEFRPNHYEVRSANLNLFGEVIRMFDYNSRFQNVVFFNELRFNKDYEFKYDYSFNDELLPEEYRTGVNWIPFDELNTGGYEKIEYIIKSAIEQLKIAEAKEKLKRIKQDF